MKLHSTGLLGILAAAACGTGLYREPPAGTGGSPPDGGSQTEDASRACGHWPGSGHGGASIPVGPTPIGTTCTSTMGPRRDATTPDELRALLLGRWQWCSGIAFPDSSAGIELTDDGSYFALVDDRKGGLVRSPDLAGSGQWDTCQDGPTGAVLELWPSPTSRVDDGPLIEDDPPRIRLDLQHTGQRSLYTWLGR